jgi:hypothetical protein
MTTATVSPITETTAVESKALALSEKARKGSTERICQTCGQHKMVHNNVIAKGGGLYCSKNHNTIHARERRI